MRIACRVSTSSNGNLHY